MAEPDELEPRRIPAPMLIHQEGEVAVIAVVGIWLRDGGFSAAFSARGSLPTSVVFGAVAGFACFGLMWLVRSTGPLKDLEVWQRNMVAGWSLGDAVAVAVFSGLAEEALIRALMQPLIGIVPAAAIFAVLHFVPDRRLWMWPVVALVLGLVLGWIFERWGYPAAAAAHVVINALSLARYRAATAS
jgi:membrane protease YdiL (CAAX protease family)